MLKRVPLMMLALALVAVPVTADPYTLTTCAVAGTDLGDSPVTKTIEGRELKFCCNDCAGKYEADPAQYSAKVDEAMAAKQEEVYPLDTCVVSGEKLGSMGDPIAKVYDNRLVKFCCNGCVGKFEEDQATYLSKLDEAVIAKQAADYPLDTCPVKTTSALGDEPVQLVIANQLVQLCCAGCEGKVNAEPAKYLAMIDTAKADK